MRIVHKAEELVENIEACKREAQNSFNDSRYATLQQRVQCRLVRDRFLTFAFPVRICLLALRAVAF